MTAPGFLSETRERFLKAILAQLPLERVRELYVFPPIRQGGVESGVAVVAGYPEATPAAEPEASEAATVDAHAAEPGDAATAAAEPTEPASTEPESTEPESPDAESPDAALPDDIQAAPSPEVDEPEAEADAPPPSEPAAPAEKYTVYTARYRHVLKGPDRGKWEASLVAEAEAPLLSIETVVRGVQRRAGDVESPDHMTAGDVRTALRLGPASASDAA